MTHKRLFWTAAIVLTAAITITGTWLAARFFFTLPSDLFSVGNFSDYFLVRQIETAAAGLLILTACLGIFLGLRLLLRRRVRFAGEPDVGSTTATLAAGESLSADKPRPSGMITDNLLDSSDRLQTRFQAQWSLRNTLCGLILGLSLILTLNGLSLAGIWFHRPASLLLAAAVWLAISIVGYAWQLAWAYIFSLRKQRISLTAWGFSEPRLAILWAVPLAFAAECSFNFTYAHVLHPHGGSVPGYLLLTPAGVAALVIATCLVAPLAEEAIFRGFLLRGLAGRLGWGWAAIISSGLFALVHFNFSWFLPLFVVGLLLSWVCRRSGSVWASVAVHMLWNVANTVPLIVMYRGWFSHWRSI